MENREVSQFEYEQIIENETPDERIHRLNTETPGLRNARMIHDQAVETEADLRARPHVETEEERYARANRNNWIENQKREAVRPDPVSQMEDLDRILAPAAQRDKGTKRIAEELPYMLGDDDNWERFKAFVTGTDRD